MRTRLGTLFLTHSGRVTDLSLCSVNYLTKRYADPNRLKKLPPLESLAPTSEYDTYEGILSIFHLYMDGGVLHVYPAGVVKDKRKMQHVVQKSENELLIGYESMLEVWEFPRPIIEITRENIKERRCKAIYDHGLFAGVHTVALGRNGVAYVSCSAPDAVIEFDVDAGKLIAVRRMPEEIYGVNYPIDENSDLRAHYIHNDIQVTHVNGAWPDENGAILVSALIQGAIGEFRPGGDGYREIIRGFVGCHGVKRSSDGQIYFADSTTGCLVFLDDKGGVARRYGINSRWLHDVHQIHGDIYAFSVSDRNELMICDISQDRVLYRKHFPVIRDTRLDFLRKALPWWRGNSTQFMSFQSADVYN